MPVEVTPGGGEPNIAVAGELTPTPTPQTAPTPTPDIRPDADRPDAPADVMPIVVGAAAAVLIAVLSAYFLLRRRARQKSFNLEDANMSAVNIYCHMALLERYKTCIPEEIRLLCYKAHYSQHTLDEAELRAIRRCHKQMLAGVKAKLSLPAKIWAYIVGRL